MNSVKQNGFIDIHSHFLPFLDDGAESYDQFLASARCYLRAGYDQVIATPHFIPGTKWIHTPAQILDSILQAEKILEEHEMPLRIIPGMEIMLTDNICSDFDPDQFLSLGDHEFYLIEFPLNSPLSTSVADELLHLHSSEGLHFVIAHPERCKMFYDNSELLETLVGKGMLIQVNIDSLLGRAGKKVQQKTVELIQAGLVHFLASDTHAREGRMPPDIHTIELLNGLLGKEPTDNALKLNPQRLLSGKKVDPIVPNSDIISSTQLHSHWGGYMQKLKNLFTHH